ncbi:MAG TPA: caspase family protein [Steroidobacteraceae bacterium]|nr:caspase family protein [Steroidobacteraceae bacterium]
MLPGTSNLTSRILHALACVLLLTAAQATAADPAAAGGERRVALVIGNGQYRNTAPLQNPPNDARLVADTLKSLGFQLVDDKPLLDADRTTMEQAIRSFGKRLRGGAVGMFYYAGHGVQVDGENYLVPVSANIQDPADIKYELISVSYVLDEMRNAGNRLNIVVLDACRNNPFGARAVRAYTRGLAVMQAPAGTLVSYATQPGNTAADGTGRNSPFASALSASMMKPGLGVFELFNDVGLTVKKATGGQQQPWFDTSPIEGNFQFRAGGGPAAQGAAPTVEAPAADPAADERSFWESVRDSGSSAELKAYIARYPHGLYTDLANARLKELKTTPPGAGSAAPAPPPAAATGSAAGTTSAGNALHFGAAFLHSVQTSATRVGTRQYEPLPATAAVVVFSSPAEAPPSFEVVAVLSHADPCGFKRCTLKDAIGPLSSKAREVGANGIIIDGSQTVKTSLTSTGIAVDARAIRIDAQ